MAQMENAQSEELKSVAEQESVARSIGERIAAYRKGIQVDQKELAQRLG